MSWNWKGELTEYSGVRFLGTDWDKDRFIDDMRREAEGLWRCGGDDDEEAWSRLSEVDAIDFETQNTYKSRGYASDSVEDSEGVLNLRKGVSIAEWTWIKELNMWLCRHLNCISKK